MNSEDIGQEGNRNYRADLRKFVVSNLLFGGGENLRDDTSFLDSGTVDSAGVLEIIMFLEDSYKIRIEPEEVIPENLDSINKLIQFLNKKLVPAA